MKRICVYCGSQTGNRSEFADLARRLARTMLDRELGLVYGGGGVGLMGVVADEMVAGGGEVIGIIPETLVRREVAHNGQIDLRIVHSMHERKALMADLSDGFVALPGGMGTLDELFEILTWAQLGLHTQPCGLLNVSGYFDALIRFLDHATGEGFVRESARGLLMQADDPGELLDRFAGYVPPAFPQWIRRDET